MIVGNGSLGKLIKDREGAILFCSGVSKQKFDYEDQIRETNLLRSFQFDERCLFYFSSIGTFYSHSHYYTHKTRMEHYVQMTFNNYWIIRLGNVWECTNRNTFINYIHDNPEAIVRDEYKYMIHAELLNTVLQGLPLNGKHEISLFGDMLKVSECLKK